MSTPDSSLCSTNVTEGISNNSFTCASIDRFSRFQIYLKNAIEDMSSGVSEEDFNCLFGKLSITKKNKSVPGKMHKKMRSGLIESVATEVKEIVEEENIKENLQLLEKLVDESALEDGQEAWRPNGNVQEHMRSFLMDVKLKHKEKLEKIVDDKEQDLESVMIKVSSLRAQMRTLESRLLALKSQAEDTSVVDSVDKMIVDKVEVFMLPS